MSQPIIHAAENGDSIGLRQILQTGVSPDTRDANGETALTWSAHHGHTSIVKDLLAMGADRETSGNTLQGTPLILAARAGHRGIVALLVVLANLNAQNKRGATALMLAVECTKGISKPQHRILAILETLITAGADLDLQDKKGETALMWAVRWRNLEAVQRLLSAGASPNIQNDDGQTALQIADEQGLSKIVSLLNSASAFD